MDDFKTNKKKDMRDLEYDDLTIEYFLMNSEREISFVKDLKEILDDAIFKVSITRLSEVESLRTSFNYFAQQKIDDILNDSDVEVALEMVNTIEDSVEINRFISDLEQLLSFNEFSDSVKSCSLNKYCKNICDDEKAMSKVLSVSGRANFRKIKELAANYSPNYMEKIEELKFDIKTVNEVNKFLKLVSKAGDKYFSDFEDSCGKFLLFLEKNENVFQNYFVNIFNNLDNYDFSQIYRTCNLLKNTLNKLSKKDVRENCRR